MTDQVIEPKDPQQLYIAELLAEAAVLPDEQRLEHELLIAELSGEVALSEIIQRQAEEDIQVAKSFSIQQKNASRAERKEPKVSVNLKRIGWVASDESTEMLATRHTSGDFAFDLVDLTPLHRAAADQLGKLAQQGIKDNLLNILTKQSIPVLWDGIKQGKNLRTISIGGRSKHKVDAEHSLNTTYDGYKIGIHGPQNRAILLLLDGTSEVPVFGLAALYDHDDDKFIHRALFLKQK